MTQHIEAASAFAPIDTVAIDPVTPILADDAPEVVAGEGFDKFGLCEALNEAISKSGYTNPTPIQHQAIPLVMSGRDVLGIAQTGTGKTAAFALPILNRIMTNKGSATEKRHGLQALVLVPTRELAQQVCAAFRQLAGRSSIRAVTIFGGQSFGMQVKDLRANPDIVVACPGRLLDHVSRRTIRLDSVSMLVLDEADQMFDMGFLPTVREIMRSLSKERQSMLFSATMPSEIKSLAMEVLTNPETVQVASTETAATIHHKLYGVTQAQKTDLLVKLLAETPSESVLVFARTKQRTKRLQDALYKGGVSATSLQGNLSQQQREKSMKGFRAGKFKVMVATDIASRGIDVASIGLVINFDMPLTTETYTHRVGRTGRALRSGTAVTLACPEDRSMVRLLERRLKVGFEHASIDGFDRVDLSGGNADEAGKPQYGRRAGGSSSGGRSRFSERGPRGGGGRFNRDGGGERFNSDRRDHNDRAGRQARRGEDGAAPVAFGERSGNREGAANLSSSFGGGSGERRHGSSGRFSDRNRSESNRGGGRFNPRGGDRSGYNSDRYAASGERSESSGFGSRGNSRSGGPRGDAAGGGAGRGPRSSGGGGRFGGGAGGSRSSGPRGSRPSGGGRGYAPRGDRPQR